MRIRYLMLEFLSELGTCPNYTFNGTQWFPICFLNSIEIKGKKEPEDLDIGPVRIFELQVTRKYGEIRQGKTPRKFSTDPLKGEITFPNIIQRLTGAGEIAYYILICPKNYSIIDLHIEPALTIDKDEIDQIWYDIENKQYAIILALHKREEEVMIKHISLRKHQEGLNTKLENNFSKKYGEEITEVKGLIIDDPEKRKILSRNLLQKKLDRMTPEQIAILAVILGAILGSIGTFLSSFLIYILFLL